GEWMYAASSRRKITLVPRTFASADKLEEHALQLAPGALQSDDVVSVHHERATHFRAHVAACVHRDLDGAVLATRDRRLLHALDRVDARDQPVRAVLAATVRPRGDPYAASLEHSAGELRFGTGGDDAAVTDDEQTVAGLPDLRQDVAGEQNRVLTLERTNEVAH